MEHAVARGNPHQGKGHEMPYYVVNAGRGRSTHIMKSRSASTPNPLSPGSVAAQLLWFGGNSKDTLCGLQATRYVDVFTPEEANCRECRRRFQIAMAQRATADNSPASKYVRFYRVGRTMHRVPLAVDGRTPLACWTCGEMHPAKRGFRYRTESLIWPDPGRTSVAKLKGSR